MEKLINSIKDKQLRNSFAYHPQKKEHASRYENLREGGLKLAMLVSEDCPDCYEKTIAISKIEEAVMWANKAIACNEEIKYS